MQANLLKPAYIIDNFSEFLKDTYLQKYQRMANVSDFFLHEKRDHHQISLKTLSEFKLIN